MYNILLASLLSCSDAQRLINKVSMNPKNKEYREELIQTIKDSSEECCKWDAKVEPKERNNTLNK